MKKISYNELESELINVINKYYKISADIEKRVEQLIECLADENQFSKLDDVLKWFRNYQENCPVELKKINLKDVKDGWFFEKETGNLVHETGEFLTLIGVRVRTKMREVEGGWDQPMVDQGTESSIAGIVRKQFNGIPHYLLEAKFEPGNYGKVQFSPTLQVTFSNLYKAHKGRKPRYSEYFEYPEKYNILYEHWLPEDGGRFYLKRIKNMLVEVDDDIELYEGFIWLTMYQIKQLLKFDNIVNPHVRSIISHL